ncbi:LLM class flavin-dependent oxidoreductase [uncultured Jatrophihabitans sp.]|uniref:LLM class flavin-dependent oxidoreductase n=1 Tax=uncultured Jatrophihabitans sp. TaxID=1610747 RepID=UPI0035CBEF0F
MRVSLMTLGDLLADPVTGTVETVAERHQSVIDAAAVADEAGFHGVHVGEHHGMEYVYSAPPVILAAISQRTRQLRLSTSVTLAANLDPVRVAEDYATVQALSQGRAEVVVGRGNFFTTTYNLFGQDPEDSHALFSENVELLQQLWTQPEVNWSGKFRAPIEQFRLEPHPDPAPRIWIGGGASESTSELAARLGLDLMLPSAFGNPAAFAPVAQDYKRRWAAYEHGRQPEVGACWHVNVARTSQEARARWEPRYRAYFDLMVKIITRVNPDPPAFIRKPFDFDWLTKNGPAIVGSPAEVADRLNEMAGVLDSDVNLLYFDMGGQPAGEYRDMVELFGAEVVPQLR